MTVVAQPEDPTPEQVFGHRRDVNAERQLRDDAAVAIPQAGDDDVSRGAVHQHPVQQHHHQPVIAGVETYEAVGPSNCVPGPPC